MPYSIVETPVECTVIFCANNIDGFCSAHIEVDQLCPQNYKLCLSYMTMFKDNQVLDFGSVSELMKFVNKESSDIEEFIAEFPLATSLLVKRLPSPRTVRSALI